MRDIIRYTLLGRIIMIPGRTIFIALPYWLRQGVRMLIWAFRSKEYYNHSYHLTPLNRSYLTSFAAVVTGQEFAPIDQYIRELEADEAFRNELMTRTRTGKDRHSCDEEPRYGRRLGWYAIIRATKPRVIVETGVDRGLGTSVIAIALKRNADEGFPGIVHATDIRPDCGHLIPPSCLPFCQIHLGDSVANLRTFSGTVDIFLHDSDHRPEYEWAEFLAIEPRLHRASLVLSDNSLESPKLLEFAQRTGRSFIFFQDAPAKHWWPGDGIGAAFKPGVKTIYQERSPG